MAEEQTLENKKIEIDELISKVYGKINNFDSNNDKCDITQKVLNDIIAGTNLSKLEKAGILAYLTKRRLG